MTLRVFLSLVVTLFGFTASAGVFVLPRNIEDIEKYLGPLTEVKNYHVPGSRVSWADYGRLKADFPFLKGLDNARINQWIVDNFATISEHQLRLGTLVNEEINVNLARFSTGYRSGDQGRGDTVIVLDLDGRPFGLLDRKGVGVGKKLADRLLSVAEFYQSIGNPGVMVKDAAMTNGILDHTDGVKEAAIMKLTQAYYDLENANHGAKAGVSNPRQTIEGYFVIEFPFNAWWEDEPSKASIYARQAHVGRFWHGPVFADKGVSLRQTDLFMAWVDGDSAKVKDAEVRAKLVESGVLRSTDFRFDFEFVENHVLAFENGDDQAVQRYFDKVLEPLAKDHAKLTRAQKTPPGLTPEQVLLWTADLILEDPVNRARMALVFVTAQNRGMTEITHHPKVQKVIKTLLSIDPNIQDYVAANNVPMRGMGTLLIPSLINRQDRVKAMKQEWDVHRASTLPNLMKVAWLLPPNEVVAHLFKALRRQGHLFVEELSKKLQEDSVSKDTRYHLFLEMYRVALGLSPEAASKELKSLPKSVKLGIHDDPGTRALYYWKGLDCGSLVRSFPLDE